jgi:hypothetical protein
MKTKIAGTCNAILRTDDGEIVAIIVCKPNSDLSTKLIKAIEMHFRAEKVKIECDSPLTNQAPVKFSADMIEDGEDAARDFVIEIFPTIGIY